MSTASKNKAITSDEEDEGEDENSEEGESDDEELEGKGKISPEDGRRWHLKQFHLIITGANFNYMSKVILDCSDFALPSSVIGSENSRHPLDQSATELKTIVT